MKRRLALLATSLALSLLLAEVLLRALTGYPPTLAAKTRSHPALGQVMRSEVDGIDEHGFRNPDGLGEVSLVAIGDSHTYGYGVAREASWPAVLARSTSRSLYVLAHGGYGILDYRWLFDEALKRHPEVVIIGLYLANDLSDYCRAAQRDHWKPILEEWGVGDSACPRRSPARERRRPGLGDRVPAAWLTTALGSAIDEVVWQPLEERYWRKGVVALRFGRRRTLIEAGRVRGHRRVMDLERPEVAEAFRVMEIVFSEMAADARARGVRLGVLLIPSKESALFDALDRGDPMSRLLEETVMTERRLAASARQVLDCLEIATADPRACLHTNLDKQLYPARLDTHPVDAGYRCYAEAAVGLLGG